MSSYFGIPATDRENDDQLSQQAESVKISSTDDTGTSSIWSDDVNQRNDNSPELEKRNRIPKVAGVQSASALFREPSEHSKKYTRPPMKTLFESFELSPEDFMQLQAAAKQYMLDENHPERRECVGKKGRGDTDMVRLKLWRCVQNFLDKEGYGERYFSRQHQGEGGVSRTYFWPDHEEKIVQTVMPLLRRVVTNERQRQYAIESRKGGSDLKRRRLSPESQTKSTSPDTESMYNSVDTTASSSTSVGCQLRCEDKGPTAFGQQNLGSANVVVQANLPGAKSVGEISPLTDILQDGMVPRADEAALYYTDYNSQSDQLLDQLQMESTLNDPEWFNIIAAIDGHFRFFHEEVNNCPPSCEQSHLQLVMSQWDPLQSHKKTQEEIEQSMTAIREAWGIVRSSVGANMPPISLTIFINVTVGGRRVKPRFTIPQSDCKTLQDLRIFIAQTLAGQCSHGAQPVLKVQAMLPNGLIPISNEEEWKQAVTVASVTDWLDGELRTVVELW